jgi:hypothetical protein
MILCLQFHGRISNEISRNLIHPLPIKSNLNIKNRVVLYKWILYVESIESILSENEFFLF